MMTDTDMPETSVRLDQSTHMSAHTSARTQHIEVITRGERRRRWSTEQKQAIVAESLEPQVSIAAIARKHGIGTGLLYNWRHQFVVRRSEQAAGFARVELLSEPRRLAGPSGIGAHRVRHEVGTGIESPPQQQLLPGIELACGDTVLASHHRS
jgi:transposase-like protein